MLKKTFCFYQIKKELTEDLKEKKYKKNIYLGLEQQYYNLLMQSKLHSHMKIPYKYSKC